MVLVCDVHVHSCVYIVTNVDAVVPNDGASASYQASVSNDHHRVGHHLLPGHHSGRQRDVGSDHGVITDAYPSFAVHVSCRPTDN
jgi:hypothetical protein